MSGNPFFRRAPRESVESTDRLWVRADTALMMGDDASAQEIYRILSRRVPDTRDSFLLIGLAAYRSRDRARAMDVFEEGLRQFPSAPALVENFLRIGAEDGQVDRPLRSIEPSAGKTACDRLFAQTGNWNTQVGLIVYCVRAGLWALANEQVNQIILNCGDTAALWRLSDILLALGRKGDADRIYEKLSGLPAAGAETAVFHGLALERLGSPEKAADRLQAEIRTYPNAPHLREQLLRICVASGQIERTARLIGGSADDPATLEALFARFADRAHQLKLLEFCVDRGHIDFVKRKLNEASERAPYESGTVWSIAQKLDAKNFASEARELYLSLLRRNPQSSQDVSYAVTAALHLGDMETALRIIEEGQRVFPSASDLHKFYVQICANNMNYKRYSEFVSSTDEKNVVSLVEFYKTAVDAGALVAFIINHHDIKARCPDDEFEEIENYVLNSVKEMPVGDEKARLAAFFCKYMDLDEKFTTALWAALRDRAGQELEAVNAVECGQWAIDILFRLTPPMVPLEWDPDRGVREFIAAAQSLAASSIELNEPIRDMSDNWTPWQYLFCSADIALYGTAMAAYERLALNTWPKLKFTAPHVSAASPVGLGRRIRIGFIVHDSMPMMSGLLGGLDPDVFETVFLHPGRKGQTRAAQNWNLRAERVMSFADKNTYAAIEVIAAEELDIIVSGPSVASIFFPMMARLARLQLVLLEPNWTDGSANADYYISWQTAEPDRPGDFYRSKVALLEHPPYYIERPPVADVSEASKTELRRRLLGSRADDRIYVCANTPPKLHPEMDDTFRKLLERDPGGTLVFLRGEYPPAKTLRVRLQRKLGPLIDRVVFLPTLKQEDAHRLLLAADACLDSFPMCGMSSSFDAAMLGVPTVTLPTPVPFGKWTATIYDYIGVSGLTAKDRDDYLRIAIRLAKDPGWRAELGAELRQKSARFIESAEGTRGFADFIARAWERHLAGQAPADWIDGAWHPGR